MKRLLILVLVALAAAAFLVQQRARLETPAVESALPLDARPGAERVEQPAEARGRTAEVAAAEGAPSSSPAGAPGEVLATASTDVAEIEVLALDEAGQPLPQARVGIEFELDARLLEQASAANPHPAAPEWKVEVVGKATPSRLPYDGGFALTDAQGLARFRVEGASRVSTPGRVDLLLDKRVGHAALLPPLVSQQVIVRAVPLARVEVSVLDASGQAVEGAYVDVRRELSAARQQVAFAKLNFARTDPRGLAVFDDLDAGRHEFSWTDKASGTAVRQWLAVELGRRYQLELRSTALPPPLCVSGLVLDEAQSPLPKVRLRVRVDGGPEVAVYSDALGRFTCLHAAGREVEVAAGGGMWDDELAPSSQRVPFGTPDVRVQRTRAVEILAVRFACTDAATGKTVELRRLNGERYRAGRPDERGGFELEIGKRDTLLFRDYDDWHVVVEPYGYERQDLALAEHLQRGRDASTLPIVLRRAPGFREDDGH